MALERMIIPCTEMKTTGEDLEPGQFSGYGSTFGNIDHGSDIVMKGAFKKTLKEWGSKNQLPLMPWYHDMRVLVGDWISMKEDREGLNVLGQIWIGEKRTENSQQAHNLITGTGPKGMSIGYHATEIDFKEVVNQETGKRQEVRRLKELDLGELSIVPYGMNPKALITQSKSLVDGDGELVDVREFECLLRDAGLSRVQAKAVVAGGYRALVKESANNDDISELKSSINNLISFMEG